MKEEIKIIKEAIDQHARSLVRMLCSEVEVLENKGVLTPDLFIALSKEVVYHNSRNLKSFLDVKLTVGKIIFIEAPKKK